MRGIPEEQWEYVLIPRWKGRRRAEIPEAAWDYFRTLYLNRRGPTIAYCRRMTEEAAAANGWGSVPSQDTFERRVKTEITAREAVLAREGPEALARLYPPQRRQRDVFDAGEAVCGDGLKLDRLYVKFEDGEIVGTTTAWVWQDLRTGLILAHEIAKTETADLIRRATRNLSDVCAPDHAWIDNTRAAANKAMTGGAAHRWRGKKLETDAAGLFARLGIEVHFTNPDRIMGSPGAKPVERAFGIGGLHEAVANHPAFYDRGFARKNAVPIADVRKVFAEEVERFNSRPKRRTAECRGELSFREAWNVRVEEQGSLRVFSTGQRAILERVPETVTANRQTGEVRLRTGRGRWGGPRFWSEELSEWRGKKVVAWFDPDDLNAPVEVTELDGRKICMAESKENAGFNNREDARKHARNKSRFVKATRKAAAAKRAMTAAELADLTPSPEPQPLEEPAVVRPNFRAVPLARATGTDGPHGATPSEDRIEEIRQDFEGRLLASEKSPPGNTREDRIEKIRQDFEDRLLASAHAPGPDPDDLDDSPAVFPWDGAR